MLLLLQFPLAQKKWQDARRRIYRHRFVTKLRIRIETGLSGRSLVVLPVASHKAVAEVPKIVNP